MSRVTTIQLKDCNSVIGNPELRIEFDNDTHHALRLHVGQSKVDLEHWMRRKADSLAQEITEEKS